MLAIAACRRSERHPDQSDAPAKSARAETTPISAPSGSPAEGLRRLTGQSATAQKPASPPAPSAEPGGTAQMPSYRISALGTRRCPPRAYERFGPGRSRFGVELLIEATGARTIVVDAYYARLHDTDGRAYAPTFGGCEPDLRHIRLAPGAKARGWVSFEWSNKATPAKLVYSPDLSGTGRAEPATVVVP
jgi:hypothetical protein